MIDGVSLGLESVMTQQAVLQRDHGSVDDLGAEGAQDWQTLSTLPCAFWWGTGTVITRMGGLHLRPEETIDLETGGMLLPEGADVTARDRIGQVLDADGNVIVDGPLAVLAVGPFEGVTELLIKKAS